MVIGNSGRRRTRSQTRQPMNINIIDNNNNEIDDNIEVLPIELKDGTRLHVGDIVGLEKNRMNTPFVVQNFNGL